MVLTDPGPVNNRHCWRTKPFLVSSSDPKGKSYRVGACRSDLLFGAHSPCDLPPREHPSPKANASGICLTLMSLNSRHRFETANSLAAAPPPVSSGPCLEPEPLVRFASLPPYCESSGSLLSRCPQRNCELNILVVASYSDAVAVPSSRYLSVNNEPHRITYRPDLQHVKASHA